MIPRAQKEQLCDCISHNKLVLLNGPRKAGKMELIQQVIREQNWTARHINCTEASGRKTASSIDELAGCNERVIVLEEAQYLPDLQAILEAVLSGKVKTTLVVACSYRPEVDDLLLEAIQMQGLEITVHAPTFHEAAQHFGLPEEERLLEERLIFGNYPQVTDNLDAARTTLEELIDEVIWTRLAATDRINKERNLHQLLVMLADELGEVVTYNDLGERCGLDNETVRRYIDLLVANGILIRLKSYHTHQRYELRKSYMFYFLDNGIRNALMGNLQPTYLRNDMDQLWKNYVVAERWKWIRMNRMNNELYFWKTHTNQQMDIVEVGQNTRAYTIDWRKKKTVKFPKLFSSSYPQVKTSIINRSTYWTFLTRKQ